jgi:hypothetical protein
MRPSLFVKPSVVLPVAVKKPELIMLIDLEIIAVLPSPQAPLDAQQWQLNPKLLDLVSAMKQQAKTKGVNLKFYLIGKKADIDKDEILYWQDHSEGKTTIRILLEIVLKLYCQLLGIESFSAKNCVGFDVEQNNRLKFSQDILRSKLGASVSLKDVCCFSRDLTVLRAVSNQGGHCARFAGLGELNAAKTHEFVAALQRQHYSSIKVLLDIDNTTFLRSITHHSQKVVINPHLRLIVETKGAESIALTARPSTDDKGCFESSYNNLLKLLNSINEKLHIYFGGVSTLIMKIKVDLPLAGHPQYDEIVTMFGALFEFFWEINLHMPKAHSDRSYMKILHLLFGYHDALNGVHRKCNILIQKIQSGVNAYSARLEQQLRSFDLPAMLNSVRTDLHSVTFSVTGIASEFHTQFKKVLHVKEFSFTNFEKTAKRKIDVILEMCQPSIDAKRTELVVFVDDNSEEISEALKKQKELAAKGITLIVIPVYEDNELHGGFSLEEEREMMDAALRAVMPAEIADQKSKQNKENITPKSNAGAAASAATAANGTADEKSQFALR